MNTTNLQIGTVIDSSPKACILSLLDTLEHGVQYPDDEAHVRGCLAMYERSYPFDYAAAVESVSTPTAARDKHDKEEAARLAFAAAQARYDAAVDEKMAAEAAMQAAYYAMVC